MKNLILFICLVLCHSLLHAQKYYAVMVKDSKTGKPLRGASIMIRSTGKVLSTSESGNVVIFASAEDSLQVRFKGHKNCDLQLAGQAAAISIEMDPVPIKPTVVARRKKRN